jgi:hypothetical protein
MTSEIEGQTDLTKWCAWCGDPATGEITVTPSRETNKGEFIEAERLPACPRHLETIEVGEPLRKPQVVIDRTAEQLSMVDPEPEKQQSPFDV